MSKKRAQDYSSMIKGGKNKDFGATPKAKAKAKNKAKQEAEANSVTAIGKEIASAITKAINPKAKAKNEPKPKDTSAADNAAATKGGGKDRGRKGKDDKKGKGRCNGGKAEGKGRPRSKSGDRSPSADAPTKASQKANGHCWFYCAKVHASGIGCKNKNSECKYLHESCTKSVFDALPKPGSSRSGSKSPVAKSKARAKSAQGKGKGRGPKPMPAHCAEYRARGTCAACTANGGKMPKGHPPHLDDKKYKENQNKMIAAAEVAVAEQWDESWEE
jgi:hypothetical protein